MPIELISQLELDGVREDVEQLFVDVGRLYRPKSQPIYDSDTNSFIGLDTEDVIYEGRCSFYAIMSRRDRFDEQGQGLIFIRQYRVMIPWDEITPIVGDYFTLLVSTDPYLVGRPFEVRDVIGNTNVGYRRLTVHDTKQ